MRPLPVFGVLTLYAAALGLPACLPKPLLPKPLLPKPHLAPR